MPIRESMCNQSARHAWACWEITESEPELQAQLNPFNPPPSHLAHPHKRLEWLAVRNCLQQLLPELNYSFQGLTRDFHGKPGLIGIPLAVSLSHSYPWVAVRICPTLAGLDIEQFKPAILRVAPRVFSPTECKDAGSDLVKNIVYWCAKETLIKIYGKKDLTLATQLAIKPFALAAEGLLSGSILATPESRDYELYYKVNSDFVLIMNTSL